MNRKNILLCILGSLLLCITAGCHSIGQDQEQGTKQQNVYGVQVTAVAQMTSLEAPKEIIARDNFKNSLEGKVEAYLNTLTMEEKVGQLFYVSLGNLSQPERAVHNGDIVLDATAIESLVKYKPGGIILMGRNIESDAQVTNLILDLQKHAEVPLFIGVDEEGGAVSRMGDSSGIQMENIGFMWNIGETGDSRKAYEAGVYLGEQLKGYGFNMDFAPVADILSNPDNHEIGKRAFGSDTQLVTDMVVQEVIGMQEQGVSAVVKHFPGHGAVQGNSHHYMQLVDTTKEELIKRDLVPFYAAFDVPVDSVLVSHIVVQGIGETHPSTLSNKVVEELLREEMGYQGVVITDSFQMGSITENYTQGEAAVMSIQAGCDMILLPLEYQPAYEAVLEAVRQEKITMEQLDHACRRILLLKAKRGILQLP